MSEPIRCVAKPVEERKTIKVGSGCGIPEEILNDVDLNRRIHEELPGNYNFELPKVVWRIRSVAASRVALQFPEGLFIFSTVISSIIEQFTGAIVLIIGDVTYGACCVDDYLTSLAQCQLLVHFGHSCLLPPNSILDGIRVMYVNVEVCFDYWHFIETFKLNFDSIKERKIAFCATVQFISSIQKVSRELNDQGYQTMVPQVRPLSRGEVLGCTAPSLDHDTHCVVFVADGRFHLEAVMIANPWMETFYRYNPYDKQFTREFYDFEGMIQQRIKAIDKARHAVKRNGTFAFVLGTLGRQGSPRVLNNLIRTFEEKAPNCNYLTFLIPEIKPSMLKEFRDTVDVWVQTSCPRLSVDWGDEFFQYPLLNPYEFQLMIKYLDEPEIDRKIFLSKLTDNREELSYPTDFYSSSSAGNWTPIHRCNKTCSCK
ncbi:2-(3-amino-3-carboxypropyl)histidine synthase subunit 1-like [Brevipalpus obovatus]|uniref:2-(3-amino-3-carboxypropyl)histidine synthase subunit 1-like n=1 Tax=Brevipalpus obovatus TaxID=246614 RepID=UPI003D9F2810